MFDLGFRRCQLECSLHRPISRRRYSGRSHRHGKVQFSRKGRPRHTFDTGTSLKTSQAIFASNAILIAAQGIASCSQIMHLREIVPTNREKRACLIAISICCGAFSVAVMCITIECSPSNTMNTSVRVSCSHGVCTFY